MGESPVAVLLMAMGGPDRLEDVEPYLLDVRGGRSTPPELVEEIRERYRAIGGKSPVPEITQELARKLEDVLNIGAGVSYRVLVGFRHWQPYISQAYANLLEERPQRLIGLCLAPQYNSMTVARYFEKLDAARASSGGDFPITPITSWCREPRLVRAIADNVLAGLSRFSPETRLTVPVVFTAHSLPERILETGDPYPDECLATMEAVSKELATPSAPVAHFAFQSQGRSAERWLGPTVEATLEKLAGEGHRQVLIAPIGFVSDHVETLYDVDVEFKARAAELGMRLERISMLNAGTPLVETLAGLIEERSGAAC
ncbi:MAG: ferrochelatase [Acidimicrobiia bacterium]